MVAGMRNRWAVFVTVASLFVSFASSASEEGAPTLDGPPKQWFAGIDSAKSSVFGFYGGSNPIGKMGWYLDLKISVPGVSQKDVYSFSRYTAESVFEDPLQERRTTYTLINLGRTRALTNYAVLFGALGIGSKTEYLGYFDKMGILGTNGRYWLKGNESSGSNVEFGIMIYPGSVAMPFNIKISYGTFLGSTGVGLGWAF